MRIYNKEVFTTKAGKKFLETAGPLEKLFDPYIEHNTSAHREAAQLLENTYKALKYHMNPAEDKVAKDATRGARFHIEGIKFGPTIKPKKIKGEVAKITRPSKQRTLDELRDK
jgi:hypothetical protein